MVSRQGVIYKIDDSAKLNIGAQTKIGNSNSPGFYSYSYIEARNGSECIEIQNSTLIGNRFVVISKSRIKIGSNCLIGNDVKLYDSDFHSLNIKRESKRCRSSPIDIGDNVFIGDNVIILKGVNVEDNSVIGAGSVVTKSIKEGEIYAGNPAKKIGHINDFA